MSTSLHPGVALLTAVSVARQEITLWRKGERARRLQTDQPVTDEPRTPLTINTIQRQLAEGNIQTRPNALPTVHTGSLERVAITSWVVQKRLRSPGSLFQTLAGCGTGKSEEIAVLAFGLY